MRNLSDKARSILVFAAYHSLAGDEEVVEVVLDDGQGHRADPDGIAELASAGLLEANGDRGRWTRDGSAALSDLLEAVRRI